MKNLFKWYVMYKNYYVYIMTNKSKTLYVGVTNDLQRRVHEHKIKTFEGFTKKYNINKLVILKKKIILVRQ